MAWTKYRHKNIWHLLTWQIINGKEKININNEHK